MFLLKQNTAGQVIGLGPFLDNTDGDTEEPGFAILNTDIGIYKYGSTSVVNKNSGGATFMSKGMYYATFDASDSDTLGFGKILIHFSGSLYVWVDFWCVTTEAYETLINSGVWNHLLASHNVAGTFGEKINAIGVASDLVDAIFEEPIVNQVTAGSFGVEIKSHSKTTVTDSIETDVNTLLTRIIGTIATGTHEPQSGDAYGRIGANGAGLTSLAPASTALLNTVWTSARAIYLDELAAANIPSDIDTLLARLTALRATYLDELGPTNVPADLDTLLTRISSARASYLDNLDIGGNVASQASLDVVESKIDGIAATGSALNQISESYTLTIGSQATGTYEDTHTHNNDYHGILAADGAMDYYYVLNIGGAGIPVGLDILGRLHQTVVAVTGVAISAYDFDGSAWEEVNPGFIGIRNSTNIDDATLSAKLFDKNVSPTGEVWIKLSGTGLVASNEMLIDQLTVAYAITGSVTGYANGAVWIDTINGVAGSVVDVNGTADNKVNNLADAITLMTAKKLNRLEISIGSTITLDRAFSGVEFLGTGWILNLAGYDIDGCFFSQAIVNGIGLSSSTPTFNRCSILNVSLPRFSMVDCGLGGIITITGTGTCGIFGSSSFIAGTQTPTVDFGAAIGDTALNVRGYSGGLEIENFGQFGVDSMSFESDGQLVINANCNPSSNPVIAIRGHFTITDNVVGGFVAGGGILSDDARFDVTQIVDSVLSGLTTYDSPTNAEMVARTRLASEYALDSTVAKEASVNALNDISPTEVNNEILDVLTVDVFPEPGQGAPPATASILTKLSYGYKVWRNRKTVNATTESLYSDDGVTVDQQRPVSDDLTTGEKGEVISG